VRVSDSSGQRATSLGVAAAVSQIKPNKGIIRQEEGVVIKFQSSAGLGRVEVVGSLGSLTVGV
jgi:hypothetical protein